MRQFTRSICRFVALALLAFFSLLTTISAATIFESGTLGPTGVSSLDLSSQNVPGLNVTSNVFNGVRFHLDKPVQVTQIGGHFVAATSGTFFGAIISLEDENDFPDSGDLSASDVLGETLITIPQLSEEVYGELNLRLDAGWYALTFGSGLFGASGRGASVLNGLDIGSPSYIGYQTRDVWRDSSAIFNNRRMVVRGHIVPEPASFALILLSVFFCLISNRMVPSA